LFFLQIHTARQFVLEHVKLFRRLAGQVHLLLLEAGDLLCYFFGGLAGHSPPLGYSVLRAALAWCGRSWLRMFSLAFLISARYCSLPSGPLVLRRSSLPSKVESSLRPSSNSWFMVRFRSLSKMSMRYKKNNAANPMIRA